MSAWTFPVDAVRTSNPPISAATQMAGTLRIRTNGAMAAPADATKRRLQPAITQSLGSMVSGTHSQANHGAYRYAIISSGPGGTGR